MPPGTYTLLVRHCYYSHYGQIQAGGGGRGPGGQNPTPAILMPDLHIILTQWKIYYSNGIEQ